jgi:hypothetical protein
MPSCKAFFYFYQMKKLMLVFILLFFSAKADLMEKERLKELLNERKEKFQSYFSSIDKRSGIFGNKTKKDILQSNEVLVAIVKTDNNIISVLNRALDYKSFEKTSFSYDKLEQDKQIDDLKQQNSLLAMRVDALKESFNKDENRITFYKMIIYIELAVLIFCLYIYLKKQKAGTI